MALKLHTDVRTRFSPPTRVQLKCEDPSLTQQDFTEECDINNVILRFAGTGELPPRHNGREPEFIDVSEFGDLHETLSRARAGREAFDALPAEVRASVGNDPERLLQALDEHARFRASTEEDVTKPSAAKPPAATPPVPESA